MPRYDGSSGSVAFGETIALSLFTDLGVSDASWC